MITKFNSFLNESILPKKFREMNLLYHSTDMDSFIDILMSNKLYGTETYDFGVATSRNKDYLFGRDYDGEPISGLGEAQLILDRDLVRKTYKIEPYDFENYKRGYDTNLHQAEDKILTNVIPNIFKYIVGIQINKDPEYNIGKILGIEEIYDKLVDNQITLFDNDWKIIHYDGYKI